jgi:hypothetical protein
LAVVVTELAVDVVAHARVAAEQVSDPAKAAFVSTSEATCTKGAKTARVEAGADGTTVAAPVLRRRALPGAKRCCMSMRYICDVATHTAKK